MLGVLLLLKRRNGLKQGGCSDGDDNDDVDDDGEFAFYGAASGKTFASLALLEVSNGERVSTSSTCRSASRTLNSPNRNCANSDAEPLRPQPSSRGHIKQIASPWHGVGLHGFRSTFHHFYLNLITKSYILYAETQSAIPQGLPPRNHPG